MKYVRELTDQEVYEVFHVERDLMYVSEKYSIPMWLIEKIRKREAYGNVCVCDASDLQPFGECICGAHPLPVEDEPDRE